MTYQELRFAPLTLIGQIAALLAGADDLCCFDVHYRDHLGQMLGPGGAAAVT